MNFTTKLGAAALIGASLALSACATGLADPGHPLFGDAGSRPGRSFFVVQSNGQPAGLEFGRYASHIAQHLQARGYRQAASPQAADMLVKVGFDIDEGRTEYDDPFANPYYGARPLLRRRATAPTGAIAASLIIRATAITARARLSITAGTARSTGPASARRLRDERLHGVPQRA